MASASLIASITSSVTKVAGEPMCSGWSVGNAAPTLRLVVTRASSASASCTRRFQSSSLRDTRPARISGRLACEQHVGRLLDQLGGRAARHRRHEALVVDRRQRRGELALLHLGVEIDVGRAARRGVRHPVGAQHGLAGRAGRRRLVVPLGVVANDRALVGGGVDPVDPRAALHRIHRAGGAENQHGHAVAPGVEDRHGGVEQADVGVHRRRHRLAGDLGVAVRDRDRRLFVQAQQHLRLLVAEEVDDRVVQAAIGGAGIERDVGDIERTQRLGDDVAAESRRVGAVGNAQPLHLRDVRIGFQACAGFRCHCRALPHCGRQILRAPEHTGRTLSDAANAPKKDHRAQPPSNSFWSAAAWQQCRKSLDFRCF